MTDFVIVIATAAALALPVATPSPPAGAPQPDAPLLNAPVVGFRTYPSVAACEQAAAGATAPAGARLLCLPVEAQPGELTSAH